MEQSLLETIIYAFTIRDSEFYHPQRCLCQSYRLRTRSQPLLFDCTIFCCIVAEMDYSIERTFFFLSSGPQKLRCITLLILRCLLKFHIPLLKMILFVITGRNWTKLSTRLQFETPNFSRNITRQVAKFRSFFGTSRYVGANFHRQRKCPCELTVMYNAGGDEWFFAHNNKYLFFIKITSQNSIYLLYQTLVS